MSLNITVMNSNNSEVLTIVLCSKLTSTGFPQLWEAWSPPLGKDIE